ncbi:hypothetical protein ADU80_09555 [Clostridium botulinum]|uniref:Uncharacterized protein n=1 Tax=Clostridium botulinum TaxID=1491 RepID=A0A9Q1UWK7_CLOBO|nr:hypothetical protein [Clostridium botulinum]AEB77677.1 hypothetical protein CbC4_8013 [Clostridium botulinum BKT015925]KOA75911.1 hypothetical protein ADU77_10365 [Clostridium botulinum]KOA82811.1 hypothetical protein ADU74_13070 [Clostridium botulinum]KOA84487.1 hypothetical protein ADU80_09555 [Clostridium botulinum]KOA87152.1 hypothetical protein ADU75_05000 [Clostridium botulinum]
MTLEEQLFWMELEHREKKAKQFNTSKVNLNAEGEELRQVLANMQGKETISNREFKYILYCMDYNNWTLKEIIQATKQIERKSINVLQIVSCSKEILER